MASDFKYKDRCPQCGTVHPELSQLRAELAAVKRDAERIDGLISLMGCVLGADDISITLSQDDATYDYVISSKHEHLGSGRGLRAAIDAAIQEPKP